MTRPRRIASSCLIHSPTAAMLIMCPFPRFSGVFAVGDPTIASASSTPGPPPRFAASLASRAFPRIVSYLRVLTRLSLLVSVIPGPLAAQSPATAVAGNKPSTKHPAAPGRKVQGGNLSRRLVSPTRHGGLSRRKPWRRRKSLRTKSDRHSNGAGTASPPHWSLPSLTGPPVSLSVRKYSTRVIGLHKLKSGRATTST